MWPKNGEGYTDYTASKAVSSVAKKEKKEKYMAKKRNCRRTIDEEKIHEKAVKMRKMTDEQLVHYVEDRVAKAESEGYNKGKGKTPKGEPLSINKIINEIAEVKGIGATKLQDIKAILEINLEGKWWKVQDDN